MNVHSFVRCAVDQRVVVVRVVHVVQALSSAPSLAALASDLRRRTSYAVKLASHALGDRGQLSSQVAGRPTRQHGAA